MRISESNYYLTPIEAGNNQTIITNPCFNNATQGGGGICSIQGGRTIKSEPS